jgi:hypothetical protein
MYHHDIENIFYLFVIDGFVKIRSYDDIKYLLSINLNQLMMIILFELVVILVF